MTGNPHICRRVWYLVIGLLLLGFILLAYTAWIRFEARVRLVADTQTELERFVRALEFVAYVEGKVPGPLLQDAVKAVNGNSNVSRHYELTDGRWVSQGVDAWGQPLHYEVDSDGKGARLWSNGPNQLNDEGHVDDISVSVQLP